MIYAAKLDYRCATILRSKSNIKVTHFAGQREKIIKFAGLRLLWPFQHPLLKSQQ